MPKPSRKSTTANNPSVDSKYSVATNDVYDFDNETTLENEDVNTCKLPETKKNNEIYEEEEEVKKNIDEPVEGINRREKRQSAKVAQLAINSTPAFLKQKRLKINKMRGQELTEFCESSQRKVS